MIQLVVGINKRKIFHFYTCSNRIQHKQTATAKETVLEHLKFILPLCPKCLNQRTNGKRLLSTHLSSEIKLKSETLLKTSQLKVHP